MVALFFIAWTQSTAIAAEATTIIPIIIGIDSLFITAFVLLARRNLSIGLLGALALWAALAFLSVYARPSFGASLIGFAVFLAFSCYVLEKKLMIKSFGAIATMYTLPTLLFRASLSGAIVTLAVLMAKIGGPLIGGMFVAFPAVFLSAAIITYWAHGKEFSRAVMKVLMISGALNVMVYAVGIRYLVVPYGILYGTLFSYIISALFAAIPYLSVVKRRVWGLFEEFCAPAYRQRHPAFGWLPVSVQWAGRTAH